MEDTGHASPTIPRAKNDEYAAKIVFMCSMNRACVIWRSLLDQRLETSAKVSKVLAQFTRKALALLNDGSSKLQQSLHAHCASSMGFLQLTLCIALNIIQGKSDPYWWGKLGPGWS